MKFSEVQITSIIASYVASNKIAVDTYSVTRDNVAGLLDKIGKIYTIENSFGDYLPMFDGEPLSYGKTIEEWYQDLILPETYDSTGSGALTPSDPTYRPASYSYSLGRQKIKTTIRNDNLERAVHFEAQFVELVATLTKRLYDSYSVAKFQIKKQALANLASKCEVSQSSATTYATSTAYAVNTFLKSGSVYGVVVKAITSTTYASYNTWALNVANGFIIVLDLISTLTLPTDETTSETFIKQVKKDVEVAQFPSEGHSLNGNTIGATDGLVLVVKNGIMPVLEVDALAGAFHEDKLAIPATLVKVDNFANDTSGVFAILMDSRGMRVHQDYLAVRDNLNADGDFMNYFLHYEITAHISKNTFVKIYKTA